VFECIPEQYRKVLEWIKISTKRGEVDLSKCYRVVIPCTRHGDVTDWGAYIRKYGRNNEEYPFTGLFECWPAKFDYEIKPLDVAALTDYTEDDITLPEFFTGLSEIQIRLLQGGRIPALVNSIGSELFVSRDIILDQLKILLRGNCPPVQRQGNMIIPIYQPGKYKFPYYLINGPIPLNPVHVSTALVSYLGQDEPIDISNLPPSCPPYIFERHADTGRYYTTSGYLDSASGKVVFPYGMDNEKAPDFIKSFEAVDGSVYGTWVTTRMGFLDTNWKFIMTERANRKKRERGGDDSKRDAQEGWEDKRIVRVNSPQEYLKMWLKEVTFNMAMNRCPETKKALLKQTFLSQIYLSTRYGIENMRRFLDETEDEKVERIKNEFEGYEALLDLPIRLIGPELYDQPVPTLAAPYCARDELLEDIKMFIKDQLK